MEKISFTTINHEARKKLGLSMNEYAVADLIYNLSNNPKGKVIGWCSATRQTKADMFGFTKTATVKIINSLIEKRIVEKQEGTDYLRTTGKWYDFVIVYTSEKNVIGVQNLHEGGESITSVNNNKDNIKKEKDKERKILGPLIDQHLTREQLYRTSLLKNVWCPTVLKKYAGIRELIESGNFKSKWGIDIRLILYNWLEMDKKKGYIEEMDEVKKELNKWNNPTTTVQGKNLFDNFDKARKENKL